MGRGKIFSLQILALIPSFVPYVRVKIEQEMQMAHIKKVNAFAGKKLNSDK